MQIALAISALVVGFYIEPKLAGIFLAFFPINAIILGCLVSTWMNGQVEITKAYTMSNGLS